jgi:hypothetical protein
MRRTPHAARPAEPAALAAEGQRLVVAALAAAQPRKTVVQDPARHESVEHVLDEPGQFGTRAGSARGTTFGCVALLRPAAFAALLALVPPLAVGM